MRSQCVRNTYIFITFLGIEILFSIKQCPLNFKSGNEWWSTKFGAKLLSDSDIFSILSSNNPLDFHESTNKFASCHENM